MPIALRSYQLSAIEKVRESIRAGNKRIIIQASPGAGKTIIAASIVSSALEKGKKVIFLVHLRQLAYQAMERFTEFGIGDEVGYIMAGEESHLDRPVQIISVQSYIRRLKLDKADNAKWFRDTDIAIYDECHASLAPTRKAILDLYRDNTIIIGLSATPARSDQRPLGDIYDDIICCSNIHDLTEQGFLVPARYFGAKHTPDLKNIPEVAGEYNQKELGKRVDKTKLVGNILDNFLRIAPERQCVIFACNVKHSIHIKTVFEKAGVNIEHIDGRTPEDERQDILRRFKNGDVQVVTNCAIFHEGADFGWASAVILAKPVKSYVRYIQMASRGGRPWPDKKDFILIDHSGAVEMHGFLDESVEWNLNGQEKAWKKKTTKKKEKKIIECEECRAMFPAQPCCPVCAHELKNYGKRIATTDEKLSEITKGKTKKHKATMEEKRKFYGQLEYERRMRHYKDGWKYHKYLAKFGCAPHHSLKDVGPVQPDKSFFNFLTYQNIKFSKSQEKAKPSKTTSSTPEYLHLDAEK